MHRKEKTKMRKHMLYVITAQILTSDDEYNGSRQVPTFYLDSALQGIADAAHATDIAKTIIDPMGTLELTIHAEPSIVSVPGPSDEPAAFVPPF
jgi:hypothetical protein